jgi:GH24 family phage-related lysozyme (muramidase)
VGHLVHHGACNGSESAEFTDGITRERAFELLRSDAASAAGAVLAAASIRLSQAELDALISFVFNVGSGAFQTSTLLKKLNAADRAAVPGELGRWTRASGRSYPARSPADAPRAPIRLRAKTDEWPSDQVGREARGPLARAAASGRGGV